MKTSESLKILIVEDDPIATAVLEASVRKLGYRSVHAASGLDAWTEFSRNPFSVVVSDWLLPGLDGLGLCRRIREQSKEYTYFILLSEKMAAGDNMELAIASGVDDFLQKPVNATELRMRLYVAERILKYATQVKQLESFIPMCSYCRKVRDDKNYWDEIEGYINSRTGSAFSHGICPDCYEHVMVPQLKAIGVELPPQ